MLKKGVSCCLVAVYTIWTVVCWCFLYAGRMFYWVIIIIILLVL